MKLIHAIDAVLDKVEKWATVFLLLALTFIIFIQVIARALNNPLTWSDEGARLCFVWCVYIGAVHASRHGKHLKIDIVGTLAKHPAIRSTLNLIEDIAAAIFLIMFIPVGFALMQQFLISGQESPVLHYNVAVAYAAPAVFFLFGAIRHIEDMFREIHQIIQRRKGIDLDDSEEEGSEA